MLPRVTIVGLVQVDKDGHGWLTHAQLHRFCRLIVPDVSPGQVAYLGVMLDHDGDGRVSFQVRRRNRALDVVKEQERQHTSTDCISATHKHGLRLGQGTGARLHMRLA